VHLLWQKVLGHILGDFFHKLIWSHCSEPSFEISLEQPQLSLIGGLHNSEKVE
jgi:hypothetical protein